MDKTQIATMIMSIFVGSILYSISAFIQRNPPRDINALIGYRTRKSMKNQRLWDEGNAYSNKLMKKLSLLFLVAGVIVSCLLEGLYAAFIMMGMMIVCFICLFIMVEKHLKQFDDT